MKTKILLCGVVFLVVVLAGLCSFAADKEKFGFYVPSPNEELYGTWVNEGYRGWKYDWPQKIVLYDWGYIEYYDKVTDKDPCVVVGVPCKSTSTIIDKWTDPEGNIWYKEYLRKTKQQNWFVLDKISKDGIIWETVSSGGFWPKESDINVGNPLMPKCIYYRQ